MSRLPFRLLFSCFILAAGYLPAADEPAGQGAAIEPEPTAETDEVEGYFISRLASIETLATGVHELSKQEQANLENLIAYEVNAARAGGVNGFAGGFSERRTAAELEATGLARLGDDQRVRLDEHIAGFIADQPMPFVYRGERLGPGSSNRGGDGREFTGQGPLLQVNGSVTLEVGTSRAGTYYGGSATTIISDPKGRFSAAVTVGTMRGDLPIYDYDDRRRGPYRR